MLSRGTSARLLPLTALVAVTAIWGSTFFLIKDVVTRIPVADLLAVRFSLAAAALGLLAGPRLRLTRRLLGHGVGLGLLYGGAQILQTVGLAHTSASTSGFVTGLYVVATPLLAALILKTRIGGPTWLAVLLAGVGTAGPPGWPCCWPESAWGCCHCGISRSVTANCSPWRRPWRTPGTSWP